MTPELKELMLRAEAAQEHARLVLELSEAQLAEPRRLATEALARWALVEEKWRARGWVPPEERRGRVA